MSNNTDLLQWEELKYQILCILFCNVNNRSTHNSTFQHQQVYIEPLTNNVHLAMTLFLWHPVNNNSQTYEIFIFSKKTKWLVCNTPNCTSCPSVRVWILLERRFDIEVNVLIDGLLLITVNLRWLGFLGWCTDLRIHQGIIRQGGLQVTTGFML